MFRCRKVRRSFDSAMPDECIRSLRAAGFESLNVVKISQTWRLPSTESLFEFMKESTVRTAGLLRAQQPKVLQEIRNVILQEVKKYQRERSVELPMPAILASAIKP